MGDNSTEFKIEDFPDNVKNIKIDGFKKFVKGFNIMGLAIGTLVGSNLAGISKALSNDLIQPIVLSVFKIINGNIVVPKFEYMNIFKEIVTFGITVGLMYFILQAFKIEMKKPIQHVYVVKNDGDLFTEAQSGKA